MSSFKDHREQVRSLPEMSPSRTPHKETKHRKRGADELRYQILEACESAEQSAYRLGNILNIRNLSFVKKNAMALVGAELLSVRVVRNGATEASVFSTTPRGQQFKQDLKALCASKHTNTSRPTKD